MSGSRAARRLPLVLRPGSPATATATCFFHAAPSIRSTPSPLPPSPSPSLATTPWPARPSSLRPPRSLPGKCPNPSSLASAAPPHLARRHLPLPDSCPATSRWSVHTIDCRSSSWAPASSPPPTSRQRRQRVGPGFRDQCSTGPVPEPLTRWMPPRSPAGAGALPHWGGTGSG